MPNAPANATPSAPTSAVPGSAAAAPARSEEVVVTTDVLRLTFDTMGAQLVRAELLKYPATGQADKPTVLLDRSAGLNYVAQTGVVGAPDGQSFPTHQTPFRVVSTERQLSGDSLVVAFEGESGGLKVTKTFTLHRGRYDIDVRHDLANVGAAAVKPSLYLQLERDGNDPADTSSFYHTFTGIAVYSEQDKFQKMTFSDIEKKKANYIKQADNGWIAIVQHYFATAWVPPQGKPRNNEVVEVQRTCTRPAASRPWAIAPAPRRASTRTCGSARRTRRPWPRWPRPGAGGRLRLADHHRQAAVHADDLAALAAGQLGLDHRRADRADQGAVLPAGLGELPLDGPHEAGRLRLQALKEKYGDDKQKLNAAMMEMYRTEKINPLGGCLPMVVQIPVFISLYWVLLASVEMRGAPWILWVHDLSIRDPFFILPAIMMATMFLQIKLNPTPRTPSRPRS